MCLVISDSSVTLWTVACQAPLSVGFPRQGCWNGLPVPTSGDLSDLGIKSRSPALAGRFFTTAPLTKPVLFCTLWHLQIIQCPPFSKILQGVRCLSHVSVAQESFADCRYVYRYVSTGQANFKAQPCSTFSEELLAQSLTTIMDSNLKLYWRLLKKNQSVRVRWACVVCVCDVCMCSVCVCVILIVG